MVTAWRAVPGPGGSWSDFISWRERFKEQTLGLLYTQMARGEFLMQADKLVKELYQEFL